jgi:hypothetical protein
MTLALVIQMVLWPMKILVDWSWAQTALVDGVFIAWCAPISLWIMLGLRGGGTARIFAMIAAVASTFGPPLVAVSIHASALNYSALHMMRTVTNPLSSFELADLLRRTGYIAGLGAAGWIVALILGAGRKVLTPAPPP